MKTEKVKYTKFPKEVSRNLKNYVYTYSDPESGEIFYVGRGRDNRVFSHLIDKTENKKTKIINALNRKGKNPKIEILVHGLNEKTAKKVEAAIIDLIGKDKLSNKVLGYESRDFGRMCLDEIISKYKREKANIKHPAILFKIPLLFRYGMTPAELYEATRGIWNVDRKRADNAEYAFAIYDGIIQEVYKIHEWVPAGTTFYSREDMRDPSKLSTESKQKWEFVGIIAPKEIRNKYLQKSVNHYFKKGAQSRFRYIYEK